MMGSIELRSAGVMLEYRFEYIANIPILFLLCRARFFFLDIHSSVFCRVLLRSVVTCLLDVTMSQLHGPVMSMAIVQDRCLMFRSLRLLLTCL
jgi:hypothetical protein